MESMKRPALSRWQTNFFRKEIFSPGGARHNALGLKEARVIAKLLGLHKGDKVLDLCCGTGRHAVPLARRGVEVLGIDATPAYLAEARKNAKGSGAKFLLGDMRKLPMTREFDAVINMWTSFGYFTDPQDDRKAMRAIAGALKPGGVFLIDIVNADYLRRHAQPRRWDEIEDGGYRLEDFYMFEGRDPGHINTWTLLRPGKAPASATFFVRSYDASRLSRLLRWSGLIPNGRWGGLNGEPFDRHDSPRLVMRAKKPKR